MSTKYTPQQIIDGFKHGELEFSELPEAADDLNIIGELLETTNDKYWELNDDFWTRVGKKAKASEIYKLFEMVPDAAKIVAEGLKNKEEEDNESSEEEEKPAKGKASKEKPAKEKPVKKETPAPAVTEAKPAAAPKVSAGAKKTRGKRVSGEKQ